MWGWRLGGFGEPNAHPTLYLIAPVRSALVLIAGPLAALYIYTTIVALIVQWAARLLAASFVCEDNVSLVVGPLAVLNPWCYNQAVAGHLEMILGVAGLMVAVASLRLKRDSLSLIAVLLALPQLQFLLIVVASLSAKAIVRRKMNGLLSILLLCAPVAAGLILERDFLSAIPITIDWQENQSVPFLQALVAGGYFAGYGDGIETYATFALPLLVATSLVRGVLRANIVRVAGSIGTIVVVGMLAAGTRGPLASLYRWTVLHHREVGLYRELYDLVGFIVAAYVVANALKTQFWAVRVTRLVLIGALAFSWALLPPSRLFVPASNLPSFTPPSHENARFALVPTFQPVSLEGRGSGIDPDAHLWPHWRVPLNDYLPGYPADYALSAYVRDGNAGPLGRLGVAEVVERCLYATARFSVDLPPPVPPTCENRVREIDRPVPELSVLRGAQLVSLDSRINGNILAGDVDSGFQTHPVSVGSGGSDPRSGWIDARLEFTRRPEIAQAYGGVYTESHQGLPLSGDRWLLVNVTGRLTTEAGEVVAAAASSGYSWRHVPARASMIYCQASCAIATSAAKRPKVPLEATASPYVPLPFRRVFSWLLLAHRSLRSNEVIRLNEHYDCGWVAFAGRASLSHVRIDGVVNGFRSVTALPAASLTIIHVPSLVEVVLEVGALIYLLALVLHRVISRSRAVS